VQDQRRVGRDRRRRRRVGLCELIPKVQTLLVSYLGRKEGEGGGDLMKPSCFGFLCIHNGRRDLITPDAEFTFEADAEQRSPPFLPSAETRRLSVRPKEDPYLSETFLGAIPGRQILSFPAVKSDKLYRKYFNIMQGDERGEDTYAFSGKIKFCGKQTKARKVDSIVI